MNFEDYGFKTFMFIEGLKYKMKKKNNDLPQQTKKRPKSIDGDIFFTEDD